VSFSFAAIGARDDVLEQLTHVPLEHGGAWATETRDFVMEAVARTAPPRGAGYSPRFVIRASGHIDAAGAQLKIDVETHYARDPDAE
jgi:hypothetical protein